MQLGTVQTLHMLLYSINAIFMAYKYTNRKIRLLKERLLQWMPVYQMTWNLEGWHIIRFWYLWIWLTHQVRETLLINLWYHKSETHYTFYDSISTFWLLVDQDLIQSKVFVLVCLVFFFVLSFSVPFFKVHIMSNTNNITITYTIVHLCSYSTTKGKTLTSIKLMVPMTLFL